MIETPQTPVNDTGSVREGVRASGCGRNRTRGRRDICGCDRGACRHHQNEYWNTNVFKGNTDDMKDNVFQCYRKSPDKQQFTKTVEAFTGYIDRNMDYPEDVASLWKKHNLSAIKEPVDLTEEQKKIDTKRLIWETHVKAYVWRVEVQEKNYQRIFSIILGKCSTSM